METEEKQRLQKFIETESCGLRKCEECGKCKICNHKCEKEEVKVKQNGNI